MGVVRTIFLFLRAFITTRSVIAAENLALRQQLGVLQRSVKRARLRRRDRIFWVWLSRASANHIHFDQDMTDTPRRLCEASPP